MDCCRQPTTCARQTTAGQRKLELRQKVCNLASKEKYLGALLFKGRIKVLFEVHRHRFQAGNYWPSVLISKHDSLPCQPRTKLCHSCDDLSWSLSASTNKWLIYHCNYLQLSISLSNDNLFSFGYHLHELEGTLSTEQQANSTSISPRRLQLEAKHNFIKIFFSTKFPALENSNHLPVISTM